ncbi:MAG: hypothetical protein LBB45_07280 [Methanobrevibacter sp.]|jgi:predicted mannosyl-3-phosphoglycerate phosphatase (HAD superfamily)|nr:hypothetical protein [Candidatus Methanovirga basalitermitum]
MDELVDKLKNKALEFKDDLKREELSLSIGDSEHKFRLSGIGEKAVKIEKYIRYEEIVEGVESGKQGLEKSLKNLIENFKEE